MNGHAARSGDSGQAVFERIQASMLPIGTKHTSTLTSSVIQAPSMEKQNVVMYRLVQIFLTRELIIINNLY